MNTIPCFNNDFLLKTKLKINHVFVALWVTGAIETATTNNADNFRLIDGERCYVHDGDIYADILRDLTFLGITRNTLSKTIFTRLHHTDIIKREIDYGTGCGRLIGFRLGKNYPKLFTTQSETTGDARHAFTDAQTCQDCATRHGTGSKFDADGTPEIDPTFDISGQKINQAKAATIPSHGGVL